MSEKINSSSSGQPSQTQAGSALDRETNRVAKMKAPKSDPSNLQGDDALTHEEKVLQVQQDATLQKTKSDLGSAAKDEKKETVNSDG